MDADDLRKLRDSAQRGRQKNEQEEKLQLERINRELRGEARERDSARFDEAIRNLPDKLRAAANKGESRLMVLEGDHRISSPERETYSYWRGRRRTPKSQSDLLDELMAASPDLVKRVVSHCRSMKLAVSLEIVAWASKGSYGHSWGPLPSQAGRYPLFVEW